MRVLITGVSGYLGTAVCRSLAEAGHEVVGTSRNPERVKGRVPGLHDVYAWAPGREGIPSDAVRGTDAIVSLMGESVAGRWTASKKGRIASSRVGGTQNIVRGLGTVDREERPRVLVTASAVGYYGDGGDEELSEEAAAGHDFLGQVCLDWEGSARAAEPLGLRVVRLRFGWVIGSGSPFIRPLRTLYGLGLGKTIGSGDQWWSWVHVDDVVGLVRFALDREDVSGPLNASPSPVRQRDFAAAMSRAVGRPVLVPLPAWAVRLALGEAASELLFSRRVVPVATRAVGYEFAKPTLDEALRELWRKP